MVESTVGLRAIAGAGNLWCPVVVRVLVEVCVIWQASLWALVVVSYWGWGWFAALGTGWLYGVVSIV